MPGRFTFTRSPEFGLRERTAGRGTLKPCPWSRLQIKYPLYLATDSVTTGQLVIGVRQVVAGPPTRHLRNDAQRVLGGIP